MEWLFESNFFRLSQIFCVWRVGCSGRIGDAFSEWHLVTRRVPQGSFPGPTFSFFNFYKQFKALNENYGIKYMSAWWAILYFWYRCSLSGRTHCKWSKHGLLMARIERNDCKSKLTTRSDSRALISSNRVNRTFRRYTEWWTCFQETCGLSFCKKINNGFNLITRFAKLIMLIFLWDYALSL